MLFSSTAISAWLVACEPLMTVERLEMFISQVNREINKKVLLDYKKADMTCFIAGPSRAERAAAQQKLQVLVPALRKARCLVSKFKLKGFHVSYAKRNDLARHLVSHLTKTPISALEGAFGIKNEIKLGHQSRSFTSLHQNTAFELLSQFPDLFAPVPEALQTPGSQFKIRLHRKLIEAVPLDEEEKALLDQLFSRK